MKVEIEETGQKINYPYLGILDEIIVLFNSKNAGTVIKPNKFGSIGAYSDNWREADFIPLSPNTKVIISND